MTGVSFDVGIALDLRIRERFVVGAQVGYDVVRVPPGPMGPPIPCGDGLGPALLGPEPPWWQPGLRRPVGDLGIHAGWLFW